METIKAANKVIKDGIALLPDDAKAEWKASASDIFINEAIEAAAKAIDGELKDEKKAMLDAYAIQEANRMASTLWRLEVLNDEVEKEYRELPLTTEIVKPYNEFLAKRQARVDELTKKGNEIQKEKRELEIFMGIINGVPAEESEERYEGFKNAQQAALAGAK